MARTEQLLMQNFAESTMSDLINDSGRLQFGRQHRGEDINAIADDDPSYLRWMLDNVEQLTDDDREVIRAALRFANRTRR